MATRTIKAVLTAVDRASPVFGKVAGAMGALGAAAVAIGGTKIGRIMVEGISKAVDSSRSFEKSMSRVAGLSGTTGRALDELTERAKELGGSTVFSAQEAADAMGNFAKAGLSAKEIMTGIGPNLSLAAAGQLELAEAATISANAMRSLGMSAEELPRIVDVLAKGATSATTDVSELGTMFRFVGGLAADAGLDIENMVGTLSTLASAGTPIEMGAAQLRNFLGEVKKGTDDNITTFGQFRVQLLDAQGDMLDMSVVLDRMAEAGINADNVFDLFEKRLATVLVTAFRQKEAIADLTEVLRGAQGAAGDLERIFLDNLEGAMVRLESATNLLKIELGEDFNETLRAVVDYGLVPLVQEITKTVKEYDFLREAAIRSGLGIAYFGQTVEQIVRAPAIFIGLQLLIKTLEHDFDIITGIFAVGNVALRLQVEAAMAALGGLGDSPIFDEVISKLSELLNPEEGEAGVDTGDAEKKVEGLKEQVKSVGRDLVQWNEVLTDFVEDGLVGARAALIDLNKDGELVIDKIEGLGTTLSRSLRGIGVSAAQDLGDTLVDAMFAGELSAKKFFTALARDLAKAIVQALILRAVMAIIGGLAGGGGGAAAGAAAGTALSNYYNSQNTVHGGGLAVGPTQFPGLIQRGEFVVRKDITDKLRGLVTGDERGPGGEGDAQRPTLHVENLHVSALDSRSITETLVDNPDSLFEGILNLVNRRVR